MNIELIEPETVTELRDVAEIRDGSAVVKLNRTEAGLSQLRTELAGKVHDLTTVKGDREARNDRLRCVGLRANVEKLRKSLKAPALEFGRLIDSEAKRITEAVESLEAPIDAAIKADEARREEERQAKARAEAARLAGLRDAVAAALGKWVARCQADGITSERIAAGIDMLGDLSANPEWSEVNDFWRSTKMQTLATMRGLHDAAQRREETARLEAQRAEQERQAAIQRQQAEELARQRAELESQAQALRDEAAQLQREKTAAEQRAREQEAARIAEQQRQQAAAEAAAQAQAAAALAAAAAPVAHPFTPTAVVAQPAATVSDNAAPQLVRAEPAPATAEPATIKLDDLADTLGLTLRGYFIEQTLGIKPAGRERGAVLFQPRQVPLIVAALQRHLTRVLAGLSVAA